MIQATPISLSDCPNVLQVEVQSRLGEPDSEILSVTVTESTPYKDKTNISRQSWSKPRDVYPYNLSI